MYGDVVDASGGGVDANQGTAKRLNFLTQIVNNRRKGLPIPPSLGDPEALLNICIFRSQPQDLPFSIKYSNLILGYWKDINIRVKCSYQ